MRRLRSLLLMLPLAIAPGCVVADEYTPVHGYGYGGGYAQPYYAPRYYAPAPVYRPYYAPPPPRYYAPPRPYWNGGYGGGGRPHHYRRDWR